MLVSVKEMFLRIERNTLPISDQGCQIFLGTTKTLKNIPNDHKISKMVIKYTKLPQHIPTSSVVFRYCYLNDDIIIVYKPGGQKSMEDADIIEALYKIDVLIKCVSLS
jgi:hypothetical protein